jgi:hypothetical protein
MCKNCFSLFLRIGLHDGKPITTINYNKLTDLFVRSNAGCECDCPKDEVWIALLGPYSQYGPGQCHKCGCAVYVHMTDEDWANM